MRLIGKRVYSKTHFTFTQRISDLESVNLLFHHDLCSVLKKNTTFQLTEIYFTEWYHPAPSEHN